MPLLPDDRTPELEIVALYPHRRQLSTKVRLFLDMLVDRFAEEPRWLEATPDREHWNCRYRRVSLVPLDIGEGPLAEPTPAVQPLLGQWLFVPDCPASAGTKKLYV